jgi:hypothetical protein
MGALNLKFYIPRGVDCRALPYIKQKFFGIEPFLKAQTKAAKASVSLFDANATCAVCIKLSLRINLIAQ